MSATATSSEISENQNKNATKEFVTFYIDEQIFGIAVDDIHEVFHPQKITQVPLSPPEIRGVLNLRGRIVTAIEVRNKLNLPSLEATNSRSLMAIGVEVDNESYGLIIDRVGDVMQLPDKDYEPTPINMDPVWRKVSSGIYRLTDKLLIILDVKLLLDIKQNTDIAA